jgi:hypothetical protein
MVTLNLYGKAVQYDGRELGYFMALNPDLWESIPQYGTFDPHEWEERAKTVSESTLRSMLKDIAKEAAKQAQGNGAVGDLMNDEHQRGQVVARMGALQNTADFCKEVLAALSGK